MSKSTRKVYDPKFKMRVALEVLWGEKTLSEVASENGVSPSLACEWRDQLMEDPGSVFAKARRMRERKKQEVPTQKERERMLGTTGQLTLGRDFLQRFCVDQGLELDSQEAVVTDHPGLCRRRTCELLHVIRSSTYHEPKPMTLRKEDGRLHLAHFRVWRQEGRP
jgi:transposase